MKTRTLADQLDNDGDMRAVLLWISPRQLLDMFQNNLKGDYVRVINWEGSEAISAEGMRIPIPDSVTIHHIFQSNYTSDLGIMLCHPLFPKIPTGGEPLRVMLREIQFKILKRQKPQSEECVIVEGNKNSISNNTVIRSTE